ncbi:MAG TPA: LamG-like jellyroll fold domain-containing protein [Opitutales bacterium]|nr:LamG-like jellyroll fold domain-containing protein [Opitutales bacterium]
MSAQTLLLHYTFDEIDGDALDYGSAPAAPGVFSAPATRTASTPGGWSSGALNAVADNSNVNTGNVEKLNGLASFTLSAWINLQGAPANGNRIMAKQLGSGNFDGFSFAMSTPTSGTIGADNFRLNLALGGESGFQFNLSAGNLNADKRWIFVAATYDGAGNVSFYSGDVAQEVVSLGAPVVSGVANPGTLASNTNDFRVASSSSATISAPIWIDDVRVYSGALDAAQLETLRLENIPEPSTYAAIFGGLVLLAAGLHRYRRNRA